jgi:hypothetical protein
LYLLFRGSGVFVNIGKVLVVKDEKEASEQLNTTCYHLYEGCLLGDKLWCDRAIKKGYDSIIIQKKGYHNSQVLVKCSGSCATKPLSSPCPFDEVIALNIFFH